MINLVNIEWAKNMLSAKVQLARVESLCYIISIAWSSIVYSQPLIIFKRALVQFDVFSLGYL